MSSINPSSTANPIAPWTPRSPADRILFALKMHGDQTAAHLGKTMGTSGEAARQQLVRLAEDGLVECWSQAKGVGRPAQFWTLTEKGQTRFPDTHAALTADLLDMIRSELGEPVLETLIDRRETRTRAHYLAQMSASMSLGDRVERLADLRSLEGYMADFEAVEGGYMLYENHCPICAAATACQNFCRAELAVFRDVMGPDVDVEREDHIIAGARRCAYRITPRR